MDQTDYTRFKVRVFAHNIFHRFRCLLCSSWIEKDGVSAVLEGYTEDRQKKEDFGDICRECLDVGREGAAERMRYHAEHLREHAAWLEQLASDVLHAENWASSDDLDRARKELDEKMGWIAEDKTEIDDGDLPF